MHAEVLDWLANKECGCLVRSRSTSACPRLSRERGRWGWRGPGNREGDRGEGDGIRQRASGACVLSSRREVEERRSGHRAGRWARVSSGTRKWAGLD